MDSKRIAELRALADDATPGPWGDDKGYRVFAPNSPGADGDDACILETKHFDASVGRDTAFIAAARTVVPELLDALEYLQSEVTRLGGNVEPPADPPILRTERFCLQAVRGVEVLEEYWDDTNDLRRELINLLMGEYWVTVSVWARPSPAQAFLLFNEYHITEEKTALCVRYALPYRRSFSTMIAEPYREVATAVQATLPAEQDAHQERRASSESP